MVDYVSTKYKFDRVGGGFFVHLIEIERRHLREYVKDEVLGK